MGRRKDIIIRLVWVKIWIWTCVGYFQAQINPEGFMEMPENWTVDSFKSWDKNFGLTFFTELGVVDDF